MSYEATLPSAASFYVSSIPSLQNSSSLLLYAGNLPARPPANLHSKEPENDAHLYFLLEKARHLGGGPGGKRRLLLWFNGGPGCSSFDGVMMEIGSFRPSLAPNAKGSLEWTTPGGAWNEYTDVLFLDQPVGTGFSYVNTDGYAKTLEEAAQDVNYFMHRFLEIFPEYKKESGTEFFIAGESL
jgi:carboxypeptidase D